MKNYDAYLKSEPWIDRRRKILLRDREMCTVCRSIDKPLEVHHIRYGRSINPCDCEDKDLVTLCPSCHEMHHKFVLWIQREITDIPPRQLIKALRGDAGLMADLIAEIAGRLASISWCLVKEMPLE